MVPAGSLDDLLALEKKYAGQRGFVVATGPSLAYKNVSFLKSGTTIGVNLSPLMFDQWGFQPDFNLVADMYVCPAFKEVFDKLTNNTPTKKIIVASACDTFPQELSDENTYFVSKKLPQEIVKFSENPIRDGFWRGKTVVYDALQLAFFLGFDEMYILGLDLTVRHDWGKNGHCYEIQKNQKFPGLAFPDNQSHIIQRGLPGHPEYFKLISKYMAEAKNHFESAGRKVFNDVRSKLDVFEKKDILNTFGYVPKVVAFVPSKGTSTRVKSKNIRVLGDKPLFLHVLDMLLKCHTINKVYLDSESETVFDLAKGRAHKELKRPVELASNKTDGNQLLLYEASQADADIYVQVLPTAPFLSAETIDKAVYELIKSPAFDSAVGVRRQKAYLWGKDGMPANYDPQHIPNSFDLDDIIIETMGLYAIRKPALLETRARIGKSPCLFEVPLVDSSDINTDEDFNFAEIVWRGLHG